TFLTRMYFDSSNNAWMTTMATPDVVAANGQHRILACVDILLDDLMERLARPSIEGAYSTLFLADAEGTLMFHPQQMEAIKQTEGKASIQSLHLGAYLPLLHTGGQLKPGKVVLVDTSDDIVAVGRIPETPTILTIHYPRALMQPAILQNLAVVAALGLVTLLVEVFLLRSILQNQVTRPLQRLMRATRAVGATAELEKYDLPVQSEDEIGELARDFTRMSERIYEAHERLESMVQQRTLALEEANQKLAALSITDSLTGLANRRHFDKVLGEEWGRATRSGSYIMLAMLDVDWFKKYNDHYGHQAGDECLRCVAHSIQAHASRVGDLVARYGGEEFVLIVTSTNPDGAQALVQSICQAVQALQLPHLLSPFGVVTVSIGMAATVPRPSDQPTDLLQQADAALYRAKEAGRNQVVQA
ncbi:MAG: diguanylate cyclase, partial [Burkholderiaceae bacterium]|nr:diguanylate cyclase [Burkholderiaceae bacterium]